MTDTSSNWVDRVTPEKRPVSPWTAVGWVVFTFAVLVLPAAVWAGWQALL